MAGGCERSRRSRGKVRSGGGAPHHPTRDADDVGPEPIEPSY